MDPMGNGNDALPFYRIRSTWSARRISNKAPRVSMAGASGSEPEPEEIYRRPAALEAAAAIAEGTFGRGISWEWHLLGSLHFNQETFVWSGLACCGRCCHFSGQTLWTPAKEASYIICLCLYTITLYYIILYYVMLYYVIVIVILYIYINMILCYIILCYVILYSSIVYCIILYYVMLCYITLYYVILYCIMLYYIILCYIIF